MRVTGARSQPTLTESAVDDILVWKCPIRDVEVAAFPRSDGSSPIVMQGIVVGAVHAPGMIFGIRRDDGHPIWQRKIGKLAFGFRGATEDVALIRTEDSLTAFASSSGQTVWRIEARGESRWPSQLAATASNGSAIFGGPSGNLEAVDVRSGESLWTTKIAGGVASTPVVDGTIAVFSTNEQQVMAVDTRDGRIRWSVKIDGNAYRPPVASPGGFGVFTRSSLILLDCGGGGVVRKWTLRKHTFAQVEPTTDGMIVVTRRPGREEKIGDIRASMPVSCTVKAVTAKGRVLWESTLSGPPRQLRFEADTNRVYEIGRGLSVRNAKTGAYVSHVRVPRDLAIAKLGDIEGGRLYLLGHDGNVFCVRDPATDGKTQSALK